MGHYSAWMGHHFGQMGHQMGHHSGKMGHEGTPMDTKMVFRVVIVKYSASRGVSTRFTEAERLKNEVAVA
jgi:hypothetical protein